MLVLYILQVLGNQNVVQLAKDVPIGDVYSEDQQRSQMANKLSTCMNKATFMSVVQCL